MFSSLLRALGGKTPPIHTRARLPRRRRLAVEHLEERALLSARPITDMTLWAKEFKTHAGPTNLSFNFDGETSGLLNRVVAPFQPQVGPDRGADIQEILFRTAEIFGPFDVQVRRIS